MAGARAVRIGGAGGFLGDSQVAAPQLIAGGNLDYLVLDYLAEATMSVLGRVRRKAPAEGYARDFTDWVWKDNLAAIREKKVRIVTNAGGVNPHACRERMEKIAAEAGYSFRIAVIEGDDLIGRVGEFAGEKEMFKGDAFPAPETVLSANAYLGAFPIVRALAEGADVVITGRVVDSALTLGPLAHEFGWKPTDYDQLAAGSLAGHVIECGAQATGGLFTDWEDVPDWAHIGYPVIECHADGSFVVTKPEGTGGLVTPAVVAEQILYEVGDPQAYALPDVVCDFSAVTVKQVGENRVLVENAKGYAPSGCYKVSVTYTDGWRCIAPMPVVGRDAARKARRQAEAVLTRLDELLRQRNLGPFRATRVEILGAESSYGAQARDLGVREVVTRIGVEHDDRRAMELFLREFDAPTTSMSVGTTGWFCGRPAISPVARVFSFLLPREKVTPVVAIGDQRIPVQEGPSPQPFDPAKLVRPQVVDGEIPAGEEVEVPLVEIAWARSGDKGDAFNIGVIARHPALLPVIRRALTPEALLTFFAHEFEGAAKPEVRAYELPGLNALNFHLLDALGGGQFASLRMDPLAKGKAQQLLDMPVKAPVSLLKLAQKPRSASAAA
ncbi:acyclic terpene utilization AtuA family protein [Camelimonas abortus]|uniref:Acyclic terpene utilization AtuA family protein n=1 Tax=Camelimonas abortus TaxID=1017184 RepID=A0ABV7LD52_9HYPH